MRTSVRVVVSTLCLLVGGGVSADVIYRETFATAANVGNQPPADWGWTVQSTAAFTQSARISGGSSAGGAGGVFPDDVNSDSRVGEPIGTGTAALEYGFIAWQMANGGQTVFAYTQEYAVDRDLYSLTGFSLDASGYPGTGGVSQDQVRLAVQTAGQWYVTDQAEDPALQSAAGGQLFATEYGTLTYAGDLWRTLTVSGSGTSSTFALGAAATALPDGDLTGLGVLWDMAAVTGTSYPRWDNFTVNGVVPEPAGLGLFLLGGALLLGRRARRAA